MTYGHLYNSNPSYDFVYHDEQMHPFQTSHHDTIYSEHELIAQDMQDLDLSYSPIIDVSGDDIHYHHHVYRKDDQIHIERTDGCHDYRR